MTSQAGHSGESGTSRRRVEDYALVTGAGRYSDDIRAENEAHGAFLRSPHARAAITRIETSAAASAPGVVAVLTSADMTDAGFLGFPCISRVFGPDSPPPEGPHFPALAGEEVRHVGQAIALVIAESAERAADAAELIEVDYAPLPAVIGPEAAVAADAPALWDGAPGNVYFEWTGGDAGAVDAAFEGAAHVVKRRIAHTRLIVNYLEPRAAVATYDAASDRWELDSVSQGVVALRGHLAASMGIEPDRLTVRTGDVGGGFGGKTQAYPEQAALLVGAKVAGRPVRWRNARQEGFMADNQGRGAVSDAEIAFDADGKILGLRTDTLSDLGAYLAASGAQIAIANFWRCLNSVYAFPAIHVRNRCVMTSGAPIGPYRGAGRPEANYLVERLLDEAAAEIGIDRLDLRRRNQIQPSAMPYQSKVGVTYDSGDFPALFDEALSLSDADGLDARRAEAKSRGKLHGFGLASFLETSGGFPREACAISIDPVGRIVIQSGNQSQGQGHQTSFAQLAADRLGVPFEAISVEQGDTDAMGIGGGSNASRSLVSGGTALYRTSDEVIGKGTALAAGHLEAAEDDIAFENGTFVVSGTDRSIGLFDLAARFPGEMDSQIDTEISPTFPNGCHTAEVEIDPDTGVVQVTRYNAVDDAGNVVNPMIVEGQLQGGLAQGLGEAVLEQALYDPDSGQLLTGSFMDYALPRADDMPEIHAHEITVPCTTNPIGAKGAGEAGTTGAIGAIHNAIADALRRAGGASIDMPATPEKVWRALNDN